MYLIKVIAKIIVIFAQKINYGTINIQTVKPMAKL